jgi:hypothetical protein
MKFLSALAAAFFLAGCISISSGDAPQPAYVNACANLETQCGAVCGNAGVQSYSCSALPGEGINLRCTCRKPGQPL